MSRPSHPSGISLLKKSVVRSTNHEAPAYIFFSFTNNSYIFGSNISFSTLLSNTISVCFFLNVKRPSFTPIHNRQDYTVVYLTLHILGRHY
jgi:hypothetical protein